MFLNIKQIFIKLYKYWYYYYGYFLFYFIYVTKALKFIRKINNKYIDPQKLNKLL